MDFKLKEVMDAVGPSAALAFAAWLFVQLLQQRYTAAYTRYRKLVESVRGNVDGERRDVVKGEILLYRKRVLYMLYGTNLGMVAAILLLLALISSGLDAVFKFDWLKYIGAAGIVFGMTMVVICCCIVIVETTLIKQPIEAELQNIERLRDQVRAGCDQCAGSANRNGANHVARNDGMVATITRPKYWT
jgi:hypothetical protein